jgi:hypothetical protein
VADKPIEASIQDCMDAILVLFKPGQVVELRAFGVRGLTAKKKFTLSGYYDNFDRLAEDAIRATSTPGVSGVFWTLQTIKPALLMRSANRYVEGPAATTCDADVAWYSWLPVDFDPVRPSGVSATDAEKIKALEVMERVAAFFADQGVTTVCADSGNGYHLLIPVQLGVKDAPLVARVLAALDERYSTDEAKIDRVNFNPSRIFKVYGTVARKGEASEERPHRAARLLSIPNAIPVCASRELLEKIASAAPPAPEKKIGKKAAAGDLGMIAMKMEEFLAEGKVEHGPRLDYKEGFKWLLHTCPFNPEHVAPSIIVTVADNGAMDFKCSHNSCFDKVWSDFRKYVETKLGHAFVFGEAGSPLDPKHIPTNPRHLGEMIRRAEKVLHGMGLKFFERNGELVNTSYARDVAVVKDIERAGDSVIIQPASNETILRDLDHLATFVRLKGVSRETVVHVPRNLPDQLHDRVRSESRDVPFPSLDMVTGTPVLLPSGKVHQDRELFAEGVLFVARDWNRFPAILERPTKDDALAAMHQFDDVFCMFPFVDPGTETSWNMTASYSVALAGVLSLVARPFLGLGAIPLIGATAPSRRSGKTKIIETVCMAALGHRPTAAHFTDEVELGKHLQPLMRAGDRAILLDNVERSLTSSKLCILVTGGVLRDRILGESRDVILKNYSVIFATGNNLVFGGDLSARAIRFCFSKPLPAVRSFVENISVGNDFGQRKERGYA